MADNFFEEFFGSILNPVENLDKAWRDACTTGNFKNYETMLQNIKMGGKRVFRDTKTGKHKVV